MDFSKLIIDLLSSSIIVIKRLFLLIFFPYRTMRKISQEDDYGQVLFILLLVLAYFYLSHQVRPGEVEPWLVYLFFLFNFFFTIFFFAFETGASSKKELISLIITFSYTLLPTLIWFTTNSFFYWLIPPPRTMSLWGKGFSIFFIAFSISLLVWKLILIYLAIRFSSKHNFYRVVYSLILYLCLLLPYSLLFYQLGIFRVPFI
jgi:hypothetical protein